MVSSCPRSFITTTNEDVPTTSPEEIETTTTQEETTTNQEDTTTLEPGEACQVPGECTGKVDGFSFTPSSIEECKEYCRGFPDLNPPITHVTYSPEKNFCECFESCPGGPQESNECPDCISSELDCKLKGCSLKGLCTVSISVLQKSECGQK